MKSKDEINKRIDEIFEKGEQITGKIDQLYGSDLQKKLEVIEDLEINLNELLNYIKEWNEYKKVKGKNSTIPKDIP